MSGKIDGVICFDTTGSMNPCIRQVRNKVRDLCKYLYEEIPNLRLGILAHGDWCDGSGSISTIDLQSVKNADEIDKWISSNRNTSGGDTPEFYEYVMHRVRSDFSWKANTRFVVMIGDDEPHAVRDYSIGGKYGHHKIKFGEESTDWRDQLDLLVNEVGPVFPIQALRHYACRKANQFWEGIADYQENVPHLELDQFKDINQILTAICMQQAGKLDVYENKITMGKVKPSYNVISSIDKLAGRKKRARKTTKHSRHAVEPSRFQYFEVDRDCRINDFVRENGLHFKTGRGFYEFTKRVLVQDYKEVVIRDNETGDMFSGDKAREILGIPIGESAKVSPSPDGRYTGFIQSTSATRKLLAGTEFLYEA